MIYGQIVMPNGPDLAIGSPASSVLLERHLITSLIS